MPQDFLGKGWSYPISVGRDGQISMSEGEQDVREAIIILLQTRKGERVMRPDYGCGLHDYVFSTVNTATIALIEHTIREDLMKFEPRINVIQVSVSVEDMNLGKLIIDLQYQIKTNNNIYNLVYPFYLKEGE